MLRVAKLLPTVTQPDRRLLLKDRLAWLTLFGLIFLALSNTSIAGARSRDMGGVFYHLSAVLGSQAATVLELGLFPLISSHVTAQFLVNTRWLILDQSEKEGQKQLQVLKKVICMFISLISAMALVSSGYYGIGLGFFQSSMIVLQLVFAQLLVFLMDESIQKGYGMGSGMNLFILLATSSSIVWGLLSPRFVTVNGVFESESVLMCPFHKLWSQPSNIYSFSRCFTRLSLPNVLKAVVSLFAFSAVLWFRSHRSELAVQSTKLRGQTGNYPVRLLESCQFPCLVTLSIQASLLIFSHVIWRFNGDSFITHLTGRWSSGLGNGPSAGFIPLVLPPDFSGPFIISVLSTCLYSVSTTIACVLLSIYWIEFSGQSSKDLSKALKDQHVTIRGFRDSSVTQVLDRYIRPASVLSGAIVGLLISIVDIIGGLGSGIGIVVGTLALQAHIEALVREEGSPLFA